MHSPRWKADRYDRILSHKSPTIFNDNPQKQPISKAVLDRVAFCQSINDQRYLNNGNCWKNYRQINSILQQENKNLKQQNQFLYNRIKHLQELLISRKVKIVEQNKKIRQYQLQKSKLIGEISLKTSDSMAHQNQRQRIQEQNYFLLPHHKKLIQSLKDDIRGIQDMVSFKRENQLFAVNNQGRLKRKQKNRQKLLRLYTEQLQARQMQFCMNQNVAIKNQCLRLIKKIQELKVPSQMFKKINGEDSQKMVNFQGPGKIKQVKMIRNSRNERCMIQKSPQK